MVQKSGIQCYNCKEFRHVSRECQKPKRVNDTAYHREKMLLCKQEEAGIQLNAEQADWKDDTNDEYDDQELEAHYMYIAKVQEVSPDVVDSGPIFDTEPEQKVQNTDHYDVFAIECQHPEQSEYVHKIYLIEQDAQNVINESVDINYDSEQINQNDEDTDLAKERELLASLIKKLKCEIDESKNRNKFLETSNKVLIDKLKELKRRDSIEYASEMELECAKVREMKNQLSAHQDTISILKQQKDAQIKLYKTREDKELEKVIELENKVKCLNEEMVVDLRYFNSLELEVDSLTSQLEIQRTQFVNEIDRLSREYYYADHMHAILGVYTELDEVTNLQCDYLELLQKCKGLETELSKSKMMSNFFESIQKHAINLELELQQCKEKIKNDMSFKVNKSKDFCKEREQYFEIQDLKAQLQDKCIAISELKKLIEKLNGKSVETKFEKSLVIRQPNAFKSQRPLILGKPTTFSNSFVRKDFSKSTSVTQTHVSNDFSKPITAQILHANKKSILKNTNVLNPGIYKIHTDHTQTRTSKLPPDSRKTNKRVTFSTGVIPSTSVSRPQLKINPIEDRVLRNDSHGKKQEVEDHRRNVKLSKNKTSVTACNDSLNAKTLNVKSISMCDKCVLHDKHDMEIVLFIVDSRCLKHMTGNLKLLINFVEKFMGTVKFGNDQIAPILGYGDLVQGAVTIKRVYYIEGLNHNLFSIGQFCDADLEVAFQKSTCFICDLKGNDLLTGSRGTDLYLITLQDTNSPNPICFVAKAT
nr:integrase, catalytic region, zinc finger, CCHC-type, peptidase aspartic, catalytic [Tanacetum cinerariifolium]